MSNKPTKRKKDKQMVLYNDDEIQEKRAKVQRKNTKAADKSTSKQLLIYLNQIGCRTEDFWTLDTDELDAILAKFWFAARSNKVDEKGIQQKYMIQSLRSIRYGINRVLKEKKYGYDITTSEKFSESQKAFEDACKELKEEGFGHISHTPEISPEGK